MHSVRFARFPAGLAVAMVWFAASTTSAQDKRHILDRRPIKQLGIQATFVRLKPRDRSEFRPELRAGSGSVELVGGERIEWVKAGSPSGRAGLRRGDVIVAVDSARGRTSGLEPIRSRDSLRNATRTAGDRLKLLVRKKLSNGRPQVLTVHLPRQTTVPR